MRASVALRSERSALKRRIFSMVSMTLITQEMKSHKSVISQPHRSHFYFTDVERDSRENHIVMSENRKVEIRRSAFREFLAQRDWTVADFVRRAFPNADEQFRKKKQNAIYNFLKGRSNSLAMELSVNLARSANVDVERLYGETLALPTSASTTGYLVGEVECGAWKEAAQWPQEEWQPVNAPPPPTHTNVRRFWLRVVGRSMEDIYPPGTLLECVHPAQFEDEIKSGLRVIVMRHDDSGLVEATCKELKIDDERGVYWLWPRSQDPEYQQPIKIDPSTAFDELSQEHDVAIQGIVIRSIRNELP